MARAPYKFWHRPGKDDLLRDMHAAGHPIWRIATEMGVANGAIVNRIRALGLDGMPADDPLGVQPSTPRRFSWQGQDNER